MLLDEQCDLVLCAGTDYDGLVPSLEFDFNADLANNFGCSIVVAVKGFRRRPEEALQALHMAHESLVDRRGELLATMVNGCLPGFVDLVAARTSGVASETSTCSRKRSLGMPTIGEISECSAPIVFAAKATR